MSAAQALSKAPCLKAGALAKMISTTHPFTAPQSYTEVNLAPHWQSAREQINFAQAVSPQSALFADKLAPKQISTPEYAFNVNYGYHLDAAKFAEFLRKHCVEKLGVTHIKANVPESTRRTMAISPL